MVGKPLLEQVERHYYPERYSFELFGDGKTLESVRAAKWPYVCLDPVGDRTGAT